MTGRSLPSIPKEVNDIAVLSQIYACGRRLSDKKTLFLQVELFFNSEYGLQKEPNINIHFTQIKEQTTAREIAEDM